REKAPPSRSKLMALAGSGEKHRTTKAAASLRGQRHIFGLLCSLMLLLVLLRWSQLRINPSNSLTHVTDVNWIWMILIEAFELLVVHELLLTRQHGLQFDPHVLGHIKHTQSKISKSD